MLGRESVCVSNKVFQRDENSYIASESLCRFPYLHFSLLFHGCSHVETGDKRQRTKITKHQRNLVWRLVLGRCTHAFPLFFSVSIIILTRFPHFYARNITIEMDLLLLKGCFYSQFWSMYSSVISSCYL